MYLGGDTGPIFTLDFGDIPALIAATNLFWSEVQASGVAERVTAIVDEIDARRPQLVGLQEVFQFVAVEFGSGTPTVVEVVDLLAYVESEIAARALPYDVVAVQENTSTGAAFGLPLSPTRILQFTDRLVALRRTDVAVTGSAHGTYAATFQLGPLTLERGWLRVTTEHNGVPYHFLTTHLESQSLLPLQVAQASELINGVVAGLDGVTIVAGDLNSDPENPGEPSWTRPRMTRSSLRDSRTRGVAGDTGPSVPDSRAVRIRTSETGRRFSINGSTSSSSARTTCRRAERSAESRRSRSLATSRRTAPRPSACGRRITPDSSRSSSSARRSRASRTGWPSPGGREPRS